MPEAMRLVQDDDSHWYLVPWDKASEFYDKLVADPEAPMHLDWCKRVDSPYSLKIFVWEEA